MNISKFTQKSIQAVQDLEKIAYEYGNQEVEQEHLLYALLSQEDSLILKLIEKMEINKEYRNPYRLFRIWKRLPMNTAIRKWSRSIFCMLFSVRRTA